MNFTRRVRIFFHALAFVLGFSVVFVVGWGGAATLLGRIFGQYKQVIAQVGGIVVILLGVHTLGWLKIPMLDFDTRQDFSPQAHRGWWGSSLMGVFFAAGWTPCIGTTLGAILTLGFSQGSSGQAMWLTSGYALGLGIPFLGLGLLVESATGFVSRFRRYLPLVQKISGVLIILIGLLLLTNQLTWIAIWAQRNGLFLDLAAGDALIPSYGLAVVAGLLSFLSPCVLPLVPAYLGYLSRFALQDI